VSLELRPTCRSETGLVRDANEDAVFAGARLLAVADGVGGHVAGEVASRKVLDQLVALDATGDEDAPEAALERAVRAGNDAIALEVQARPELAGMATTLTAVLLTGGLLRVNVGDSRTYLLRDGALAQLSRDDSYVQELVDAGEIDADEARAHPARNVVLAALDGSEGLEVQVCRHDARAGDRLLLCSDGLSDLVDDDAVAAALALPDRDAAADRLVELALAAGGKDNVSVVVADVAEA
jgi:protein phosphatase